MTMSAPILNASTKGSAPIWATIRGAASTCPKRQTSSDLERITLLEAYFVDDLDTIVHMEIGPMASGGAYQDAEAAFMSDTQDRDEIAKVGFPGTGSDIEAELLGTTTKQDE